MRLVVFFSRGMSLDGWRRAGILERELTLYRALRPHLEHLAFVTYGAGEDDQLAARLPGLEVLTNRWRLPANLYSLLAPAIHYRTLARADVFKTNQLNGAWCALIARRLFAKRLLVRCGFLWSDFVERLHPRTWRPAAARWIERKVFRAADAAIVAADADRSTVIDRYGIPPDRVHLIPNYVDTAIFRPLPDVVREPGRLIFVGRLDEQKNVLALIEAVRGLSGITLDIVGDGPMRQSCVEAAASNPGVQFLGTVPHGELPALLNRASALVMPSHYEGNPKALVEAMSCGLPVIGARVPGIREILVHRETGYLCGTSAAEIAAAIGDVLGDSGLTTSMGTRARAYVVDTCSVEHAAAREWALLQGLCGVADQRKSGVVGRE